MMVWYGMVWYDGMVKFSVIVNGMVNVRGIKKMKWLWL
jgi:hypothetical protein